MNYITFIMNVYHDSSSCWW